MPTAVHARVTRRHAFRAFHVDNGAAEDNPLLKSIAALLRKKCQVPALREH
jgi:hypothetical protein